MSCRRRRGDRPALASSVLQERLRRLLTLRGLPLLVQKTNLAFRGCCRNALTANFDNLILRLLLAVLGWLTTPLETVRFTLNVCAFKSKSLQRRARASPMRRPVVINNTHKA